MDEEDLDYVEYDSLLLLLLDEFKGNKRFIQKKIQK